MTRHFKPSIARRKSYERLQRQRTIPGPEKPQEVICWYWPGDLKPKEAHTTYFLKRTSEMDPELVHNKINAIIPGTTVKEDPALPFFIVLLLKPLTPRQFVYRMRMALKGLI